METGRVTPAAPAAILVIGYGNTLRGDDGVGRLVAEEVDRWNRPEVRAVSVTQLLPELAERVAQAREVIFVDACSDDDIADVRVEELAGDRGDSGQTHFAAPLDILRLAKECYGRAPRAWLVAIGAREFELTIEISAAARANVGAAIEAIKKLVNDGLSEASAKR